MADTLALLVQIDRENNDISVVTHEAAHQLAGNTGLLPRDIMIPTWAHEGLATYFEAPKDAAWSGIGAVNEERLDMYRQLERSPGPRHHRLYHHRPDLRHRRRARTHPARLRPGLGIDPFPDGTALRQTDGLLPPPGRNAAARHAEPRGPDRVVQRNLRRRPRPLELEWRNYMRSLRTDLQIALEGK
jgi:hypothetical protein